MWLLMLLKNWDELELRDAHQNRVRITGYCMPMEGGGRIPATAFMPVFSTYEHAEAARGGFTEAPIYEINKVPPPGSEPEDFNPYEGEPV